MGTFTAAAGVRKKHSLTYSQPALRSWARFDLNSAPCYWTASSRVLKDWMTHFHERAGSSSGGGGVGAGTDEVTFYCGRQECRLKSFNDVDRCEFCFSYLPTFIPENPFTHGTGKASDSD